MTWWVGPLVGAVGGAIPGLLQDDGDLTVVGAAAGAAAGYLGGELLGADEPESQLGDLQQQIMEAASSSAALGAKASEKKKIDHVVIYCATIHQRPALMPGSTPPPPRGAALIQINDWVWYVGDLKAEQLKRVDALREQLAKRQGKPTEATSRRLIAAIKGGTAVLLGTVVELLRRGKVDKLTAEKMEEAVRAWDKEEKRAERGERLLREHEKIKKTARLRAAEEKKAQRKKKGA